MKSFELIKLLGTQFEAELAAHEVCTLLSLKELLPSVSAVCWLPRSGRGLSSKVFDKETLGVGLLSVAWRRSMVRDTVAMSTFSSRLISEPVSATEVLRENSFSFQPFVLFVIVSLYLDDFFFQNKKTTKNWFNLQEPKYSSIQLLL